MVNQQFNIADVDDKLVMLLLYCIENNINLFKYCGISYVSLNSGLIKN